MTRLFGTDGIRGIANQSPMTAKEVLGIGEALGVFCAERFPGRVTVAVGRDTRISGDMIHSALTAGLCASGIDVLDLGVLPTPAVAYLTRLYNANLGVVISASHNPYADNGIKVFASNGWKLSDADEHKLEDLVAEAKSVLAPPFRIGRVRPMLEAPEDYVAFCKKSFPPGRDLAGFVIAVDCANGATYRVAPRVLSDLGAKVVAIACEPNGININDRCGALHPEHIMPVVREAKAHLGLSLDGDGDRVIAVDEGGTVLTGDQVLGICARWYLETGRLRNQKVVATVMANCGFLQKMAEWGISCEQTPVGDRHVFERMQQTGAVIGGEPSGHTIFLDHHTSGDGLITALQLIAAMQYFGRPLSELRKWIPLYPQVLLNVEVRQKPALESLPAVQEAIRAAEKSLRHRGRVLVRYSGTEPVCRIMVEGPDEGLIRSLAESIADALRHAIGNVSL